VRERERERERERDCIFRKIEKHGRKKSMKPKQYFLSFFLGSLSLGQREVFDRC
jgi:hypothetical protein